MELSQKQKLQHLFWRAGFGITYPELDRFKKQKWRKAVDHFFLDSQEIPALKTDFKPKRVKDLSATERKAYNGKIRDDFRDMQKTWIERMGSGKGDLRERMILFWHNHFACRVQNPLMMASYHNTISQHALGDFRQLLEAISKEPAMLAFLNNRQNKKAHPNENFAREVMELFTLGQGHYTETDITEAARAFTGWTHNREFKFVENHRQHDDGAKTVLGITGNLNGDDVLKILLEQKQTAIFVCHKLYREFVNSNVDEHHVLQMADVFYKDYDIGRLMRFVFNADWFCDEKNMGAVIKSPMVLLGGISKQFNVDFKDAESCFLIQRALGQVLFYPPNVAGWPGGKAWIDSNTLMLRMRLASEVLNNGEIDVVIDDEMMNDEMMMMQTRPIGAFRKINTEPDWNSFLKTIPKKADKEDITNFIIHTKLQPAADDLIQYLDPEMRKDLVIDLMSLPEYQLS